MQYAVMQGCVRLRDALIQKCIGMHLGRYAYSHVELLTLKAAKKQPWRLLLTVKSKLTVQTAGQAERMWK